METLSVLALYGTKGGTTKKVAERVARAIGQIKVVNVRDFSADDCPRRPKAILLFSPAYGDSELEDGFESFLVSHDWSRYRGGGFAFCELGIYTGYSDFGHGLIGPAYMRLEAAGMYPIVPPLSLDTVPVTDWDAVDTWARMIAEHGVHVL